MKIYKIVAEIGMERILDSRICTNLRSAYQEALQWYKNEDVDTVYIYEESADMKLGFFVTTAAKKVEKPF